MDYRKQALAVLCGIVLWGAGTPQAVASETQPQMGKFLRTVEENDGLTARLEAAIRAYRPIEGDGPTIFLASAVHIGEESFYRQLQSFLDAQDLVLFESVGWEGEETDLSDDEIRAQITQKRARFLGTVIDGQTEREGRIPVSLAEVADGVPDDLRALVEGSLIDAWGNPFVVGRIEHEGHGIAHVTSLGADGKIGGEGLDADIITSPNFREPDAPIEAMGEGIQQQLADALDLVFQLGAMRHDGANWRNSDMSMEQLIERLGGRQVDGEEGGGDPLFDLLAGRGFLSKVAGVMLKFVGASPRIRELTKAMLVDVVAQADEIIRAQGGRMGEMLDVLVHERNKVVIADLQAILAEEPDVRSIAVIYGAGHLPGIEEAILGPMKYQRAGARWLTAIEVDLGSVGISPGEAKMLRALFQTNIQSQLGR